MDIILKAKHGYNNLNEQRTKRYVNKYEAKLRSRLTNDNFTILSSSCAGGIIYNRLGKQFLSPTINMYFKQGDFLKFCCNLKHYISCDLQFENSPENNFPVAKLDDIYLFFNHDKTEENAAKNWNKRKARINYDNIYILMYSADYLKKEDYQKLNNVKCNNKIVLTENKNFDLDFGFYIKPNKNKPFANSFLDRDKKTLTTLEKNFDFVEWLNHKN